MRNHPTIPDLKVSLDGHFVYRRKPLKVRAHKSHGKTIQTVTIKSVVRSAAKLVLETYVKKPKDGRRYFATTKYGDKLNIGNLRWKADRKLTTVQEQEILKEKFIHNGTLRSIAKKFNVCDMTVYRTLKRCPESLPN